MRFRLAALAASLAVSGLAATPARADVTQPTGEVCGYVRPSASVSDRWVLYAGPLLLADEDDPTVVHSGTVTCSIVARSAGSDHTATPWFTATGPVGTGVVQLPPTTTAAQPDPWEYQYVCTRLDVDGETLYWHHHEDRNAAGWWSASPTALCRPNWFTTELRLEDRPHGWALSAAVTALAEAEPATSAAVETACTVPEGAAVLAETCDRPTVATGISFARTPLGAVLRAAPSGNWSCTDVHTGLAVTAGSSLTVPDPGVTCAPGVPQMCYLAELSGALAPTTLGRVTVTSACGAAEVTRTFAPGAGRVAEVWTGNYVNTTPPTRCTTDESGAHSGPLAYAVHCTFL